MSPLNPCASTACDIISLNGNGQLVAANLCKVKRSFKPYQNEHNSVKDTGEKGKKPCNTHLPFLSANSNILKAFLKTFPTKIKPLNAQQEKKMRQEKRKKREGEKEKSTVQARTKHTKIDV